MTSLGHPRAIVPLLVAAGATLALVGACATEAADRCRLDADCASGVCGTGGQCAPTGTGPDGSSRDGSGDGEGGPSKDAGNDAFTAGCTPNNDGVIIRDEVPIVAGLRATFKIGKDEAVSTAGTPAAQGRRAWDFSGALASDVSVLVETQPLSGKWYAPRFPGATYAGKLQQGSDLLGVFAASPEALLLLGVVSPEEGSSKTELKDTPPVAVLEFPLTLGATWTTDTKVGGTAQGTALFGTYDEKYESKVDAAGELKTPLGTFAVLRVQVLLTRKIGLLAATTLRTFAFVTECYGTVATVRSAENESAVEFTRAAEIRRLSP